jgi:hypothetical protein
MFGVAIEQVCRMAENASQDEKPEAGGPAAFWRASMRCRFGAIVIASAFTVGEKRSGRKGKRFRICRKVDIMMLIGNFRWRRCSGSFRTGSLGVMESASNKYKWELGRSCGHDRRTSHVSEPQRQHRLRNSYPQPN